MGGQIKKDINDHSLKNVTKIDFIRIKLRGSAFQYAVKDFHITTNKLKFPKLL